MSKEKLLEEFTQLRIKIPYQNFNLSPSDFYKLENGFIVLQDFFLKAIDQIREETIKEVKDITEERIVRGKFLPDLADPNSYYSGLYNGYQEIKQSLKSLINK